MTEGLGARWDPRSNRVSRYLVVGVTSGGRTVTEREVIVAHVSRCRFCRAPLAHSRRRRDRELLVAPEVLAEEHAMNDREREGF